MSNLLQDIDATEGPRARGLAMRVLRIGSNLAGMADLLKAERPQVAASLYEEAADVYRLGQLALDLQEMPKTWRLFENNRKSLSYKASQTLRRDDVAEAASTHEGDDQ